CCAQCVSHTSLYSAFCPHCCLAHLYLHPFPTRRSSDLGEEPSEGRSSRSCLCSVDPLPRHCGDSPGSTGPRSVDLPASARGGMRRMRCRSPVDWLSS